MKNKTEIRFVKSQKKGWVAITKGDRDWDSGISENEMFKKLNSMAPPQINMDILDLKAHAITRGI